VSNDDFLKSLDQIDAVLQRPEQTRAYPLEHLLTADAVRPIPRQPAIPPMPLRQRQSVVPLAMAVFAGIGFGGALAVLLFRDRVAALLGL